MTKRKTNPFRGAWINERLPFEKEDAAYGRIKNEPGSIDPWPVILEIRRQIGILRFEQQWREQDPEPAQWPGLLRAITIPAAPGYFGISMARRQVRALPAQVRAVLNTEIFSRAGVGYAELFDRMIHAAESGSTADDAALLRGVLADMERVPKARRGPRGNNGASFRVVVAAINANAAETITAEAARDLAAELLRACGVKLPTSRQDLATLANKK